MCLCMYKCIYCIIGCLLYSYTANFQYSVYCLLEFPDEFEISILEKNKPGILFAEKLIVNEALGKCLLT